MQLIIGGVEREISQVESYAEYMGGALANQTAEEIFYNSRANKLYDKVLQLKMDETAIAVSRGESVTINPTARKPIESFEGETNYDKAHNAEVFYANEAARISRSAGGWSIIFPESA
jgi:hypothetical protein